MSPSNIDSYISRDERWAIQTFRPLLQALNVQNIPNPPDFTMVFMDRREWIIQGMGKCMVTIEQADLPLTVGGMHVTRYDDKLDFLTLQIVINSDLCKTNTLEERIARKIAVVHEFTHAVAALSAIARVRSKPLIERLKRILHGKAHATNNTDIEQVIDDLSDFLEMKFNKQRKRKKSFPDEHFRLGFEDFPVSYPVIFEEFLFSKEMFEEYFSPDDIQTMCRAVRDHDSKTFSNLVVPRAERISDEKALGFKFVLARIKAILKSIYSTFH